MVRTSRRDDSGEPLEPHSGPLAWDGADFVDASTYTIELTLEDQVSADHGLQSFLASGIEPDEINNANFPLSPELNEKLQRCGQILHQGHGFCVIRGLGSGFTHYTVEDRLILFLGLSAHFAELRGIQNKQGHMLSHITESKKWDAQIPRGKRHGIHSNRKLPFHNDMGADILGLQVRSSAVSGGSTYVSSSATIHNDLLSRDPTGSILKTLFSSDWPLQVPGWERRSPTVDLMHSLLNPTRLPPQKPRHILAPILQHYEGHLMISVDPARLGPQSESAATTVPELTPAQRQALKALAESAERHQLRLQVSTGDLLFINNWALLHSRDAYVDEAGDGPRRHLVRMWLRSSEMGWPIPESMSVPWLAAFGPGLEHAQRLYPVQPMDLYPKVKYTAGSASYALDE